MTLAPLLLALAASHCGTRRAAPPNGPSPMTTTPNPDLVRLIGQTADEATTFDAGLATGRLFLLRKAGDNVTWVNCGNVITSYSWRPREGHVEHTDAQNESELRAMLPFARTTSFSAELARGNRVRVSIASSGEFHVDDAAVRVPKDCKATHYASTITVGAYAITSLHGSVAERRLQGSDQGELDKCGRGGQDGGPLETCTAPVALLLHEIDYTCASCSDPPPAPPPPPRPCATCGGPRPESKCAELVKLTGIITDDINALGEACGKRFGLVAVGEAYGRRLSEDSGWQKQFELDLDSGCYRLLAVGGFGIEILETGIKDASGAVVVASSSSGPIAVLGPDGPFCLANSQKLVLSARVTKGTGAYAMWLWKKK